MKNKNRKNSLPSKLLMTGIFVEYFLLIWYKSLGAVETILWNCKVQLHYENKQMKNCPREYFFPKEMNDPGVWTDSAVWHAPNLTLMDPAQYFETTRSRACHTRCHQVCFQPKRSRPWGSGRNPWRSKRILYIADEY